MTLRELADRLQCRLEGDGSIEIGSVAGIEQAGPADLTFFANPRYAPALKTTRAGAVILSEGAPPAPCAMLRSAQPYVAFAEALEIFSTEIRPAPGIDPRASVADDAVIGDESSIGAFAVVGPGATIGKRTVVQPLAFVGNHAIVGDDCVIYSNVALREGCVIGDRVVLHNGAVVGSDGFGFARRRDGTHRKIRQAGIVVIEEDVEVGANSVIDRPPFGETRVGAGTKIDNLVQIAHGVTIGRNVLLAAQVGIAGSTKIEDEAVLAGQVGVAGHLTIGRGVRATAQSGIPNSVKAGAFVSGYPAIDNRDWLKSSAVFRKLPELRKTVIDLEHRIAELEEQLKTVLQLPVERNR